MWYPPSPTIGICSSARSQPASRNAAGTLLLQRQGLTSKTTGSQRGHGAAEETSSIESELILVLAHAWASDEEEVLDGDCSFYR